MTIPDVTTDPFASWFGNSIVRDDAGAALVCHHAGAAAIQKFRSYTHFGTEAAARRRAGDKRIAAPVLHAVYLRLLRPLPASDDHGANEAGLLFGLALQRGLLSREDVESLLQGVSDAQQRELARVGYADYANTKFRAGMAVIGARLLRFGFDGLVYDNEQEGGISYVNFRSDQVWRVGAASPD